MLAVQELAYSVKYYAVSTCAPVLFSYVTDLDNILNGLLRVVHILWLSNHHIILKTLGL